MTPSPGHLITVIVCVLFVTAAPHIEGAASAQSKPVVIAAKDAAVPVSPPAEYQETIQEAMEKVIQTLEEINADEGLSLEEKQQRAMEFIRNYRWGADGQQYFWANDLQGRMLVHPTIPRLEGNVLMNMRDAEGKLIFVEFIETCLEEGGGFVTYLWPDPTGQAPEPKSSLVRLYEPFGWVVGTGFYMETVEAYEEPIDPGFFIPLDDAIPFDDTRPASPV